MEDTEPEESPPVWRKPSEIMKLRRKKKSTANLKRISQGETKNSSPVTGADDQSLSWRKPGLKRLNPFGCSPRKRINTYGSSVTSESDLDSPSQSHLFGVLNRKDSSQDTPSPVSRMSIDDINRAMTAAEKRKSTDNSADVDPEGTPDEEEEDDVNTSDRLIPDWSLKTKARFVSPQPFSWFMQLKTTEESTGLAEYTRATPNHVSQKIEDAGRSSDAKMDAQKHSLYWQHPNLPWLRLFPRIVPDHKVGKIGSPTLSEEIQKSLKSDWTASFMSVFNQLRGGRCPYFYMCAHQFTVLFRAAGVGGKNIQHAIMTPTSRGIREALRKEDIEFSMPLVGNKALVGEGLDRSLDEPISETTDAEDASIKKTKENKCPTAGEEETEDVDEITTTDDGASSFLETLGLDTKRYKSLDPNKIKMQRESFRMIDHRAESLVLVEGGDMQALFNFLLNCQSCFASSGLQAGVPPTLLSPSPYKGATLKSLKFKTNVIRPNQTTGNTCRWYSLEVEGTILPHNLQGLLQLFSNTQEEYSVSVNTSDSTAPLNAITTGPHKDTDTPSNSPNLNTTDTPNTSTHSPDQQALISLLEKTDILASHRDIITRDSDLGKNAIRALTFKDGLYTWSL